VEAMDAGTRAVEAGVAQAGQAGKALESIYSTAQMVASGGQEAVKVAGQALNDAEKLVEAMDTVSSVVAQNQAASEQMDTRAGEVTLAVENIASVSEENSAAVEEVSASSEEMSAQVEEVTASAQELAAMAKSLEEQVSRFKLER